MKILKFFEYGHLPPTLQKISKPICHMANDLDKKIDDSEEKDAGFRKLLEAKDCLVRAYLDNS
ncbi:MAG: hypothetical protein V3V00_15790 [Saprospiraceae bacterium]